MTMTQKPDSRWLQQNAVALVALTEPVDITALTAVERQSIAGATEKRCQDFATGRWCARQALQQLGIEPAAIPVGPHREPIWPAGVAGSISHTQGYYCAAASTDRRSLGIDAENIHNDVDLNTISSIFTPQEYTWVQSASPEAFKNLFYITFSAKESFYKCMFPLVGQYIDFRDAAVEIDFINYRYEITLLKKLNISYDSGMRFQGNFWVYKDILLTLLVLD